MNNITAKEIAKMIDHSLLKPEMTHQQVVEGCHVAQKYGCASVCVKPCDVEVAMEILKDTDVAVSTVIGFPHGSNLTPIKVAEAELALSQGCTELDMVLNIGRLKSGEDSLVESDIKAVVSVAHAKGAIVKVILENAYLTDEEKIRACKLCESAGADFVKTSTGYAGGGATVPDLKLMRANTSAKVRVKAAGGVRTLDAALAVKSVGGCRFGCTATTKIMEEAYRREQEGTLIVPEDVADNAIGY